MNTLIPNYEAVIDQLGIDDHDRLLTYVKPAMYAGLEESPAEFQLGASRFGGRPDLAAGLAWPTCPTGPLPFVAQVNLSELPDSPRRDLLPTAGMLYFFYGNPLEHLHFPDDDSEDGGAEVLYAADIQQLSRTNPPDGLIEEDVAIESPQLLHFQPFNSFPEWDHPVWEYRYGLRERPDLEELGIEWPSSETPYPSFQMLGHALPVQGSVCRNIEDDFGDGAAPQEKEAYVERALGLETLFEAIDVVGGCTIYYMIAHDDLVARRWDKVQWTIQGT